MITMQIVQLFTLKEIIISTENTKPKVLSIDTNIFIGAHGKFNSGQLFLLKKYFKANNNEKIVLVDIIYDEIVKHYASTIKDFRDKAVSSLKSYNSLMLDKDLYNFTVGAPLFLPSDCTPFAKKQIDAYIAEIDIEIINASEYLDVDKLLGIYKDVNPPFEHSINKKNEFPDAIALLSLENYAMKNKCSVVIASNDKGWHNYVDNVDIISIFPKLSQALCKFVPELVIGDDIKKYLVSNQTLFVKDLVMKEIERSFDSGNIDIDCSNIQAISSYADVEIIEFFPEVYHLVHGDIISENDFEIININPSDGWVEVLFPVDIDYYLSAEVSHFVKDSIDGDDFCHTINEITQSSTLSSELIYNFVYEYCDETNKFLSFELNDVYVNYLPKDIRIDDDCIGSHLL